MKVNNFSVFIRDLYIKQHKKIPEEVLNMIDKSPAHIIASLKVLIKSLNIQSSNELFAAIKDHLHLIENKTEEDFNKLSISDTDKLLRYCSFFFDLSKIL